MRRAVELGDDTADARDQLAGSGQFMANAKRGAAEAVAMMVPPVQPDFVTTRYDVAKNFGIVVYLLAKDEKCGVNTESLEGIEKFGCGSRVGTIVEGEGHMVWGTDPLERREQATNARSSCQLRDAMSD